MRSPAFDALTAHEQLIVRTTPGRDVLVGRLASGDAERPGRSISLGIGRAPGCADGAGAVLTPAEARQLAAALLQQAAAADGETADDAASQVEVSYLGGESYAAATRGHTLL
ncbi:MAG TPA: OsmC family peroxiredoxin, partial [Streptosporangiaceae bacterium]|nr:OsmC family peroxiredoxin [Streptosporangiaceae bacterium]